MNFYILCGIITAFVIFILFISALPFRQEKYSTYLRGESIRGDDDVYCSNEPKYL